MYELIQNAYDLHIHPSPDVVNRRVTDVDLAKNALSSGMKGFVIKSHQFNTAGRAADIREMFPGCNALGSVTLNAAMGGINPHAVEMAGRLGAKIVWFPTVDAKNEHDFQANSGNGAKPYGAVSDDDKLKIQYISIFDEWENVRPEVYEVLDIIAAHGMILATGHLSSLEALTLLKLGKEQKVERMIRTHASYPATTIGIEEQQECIRHGALIEHSAFQCHCGEATPETVAAQIKAVGSQHYIISSDFGQLTSPIPHEGLHAFLAQLVQLGLSKDDIRQMVVTNPTALVE